MQQQCSTALGVLLLRQMKLTKAELTKPEWSRRCHEFADAGLKQQKVATSNAVMHCKSTESTCKQEKD
jgi:hypothetical protein